MNMQQWLGADKQAPRKTCRPLACEEAKPSSAALPAGLNRRVERICRLERWSGADRAEWRSLLRAQISRDGVPPAELAAALDAHLARHHAGVDADDDREAVEERAAIIEHDGGLPRAEAERLAGRVNDCMRCRHWSGETTVPDARQRAVQMVGLHTPHRGNAAMGLCGARYRPWRASNLAGTADYIRWHFIGQCAFLPARIGDRAS
ncbi:hypothetical protein [Chromobacterium sp. CV08]|uniref:hypothetical protein n=1 Tax=Chromobacterium sp. CV08 TaxID=3133274 RepID=UPI003DA857FE